VKHPARVPSQLSESLHRRLNAYAVAASAAGVGVLALAQGAEARIIYTKTHLAIAEDEHYDLDLNHDTITDFTIMNYFIGSGCPHSCWQGLLLSPTLFNGVIASVSGGGWYVAEALKQGADIGPRRLFSSGTVLMRAAFDNGFSVGPWDNVKNRYLGLKFQIKGGTHYGWARLNVTGKGYGSIVATLTGYAYETIANMPIIAGKTHGKDEATLGHLATGASAIPAWRAKPTAATTH
jgi:hypothetical protein